MTNSRRYKQLLAGSIVLLALASCSTSTTPTNPKTEAPESTEQAMAKGNQEYYELRIYRIPSAEKQTVVSQYLEQALLPALNRMGIDRVGAFTVKDGQEDFSIFVLVPFTSLEAFSQLNSKLASDSGYGEAAASLFGLTKEDPAYTRIESRLMKAFAGMPILEVPNQTSETRLLELRIYESHNSDAAFQKVEMFNEGETQIMREVKLGPVFFGETLASNDVPNLTYMLSADDMESHKKHWEAFLAHPDWERMKAIERYKDTVSKISNWFLVPTSYSQI